MAFSLKSYEIYVEQIYRNSPVPVLYEAALQSESGSLLAANGALVVSSGEKTRRSPKDKRIVEHPQSKDSVWWGSTNIKIDENTFLINRERAINYFNTRDRLYVFDGFAGWDEDHQLKVRVICTRAYHSLFMYNMLRRPTALELETFGEPDLVVLNAGGFPANRYTTGMTSTTSVCFSLEQNEVVILGTEYAGEMAKGVFTAINYIMPKRGVLSLQSAANEGYDGDVTLFLGLSGSGKTTLSADGKRRLIGDDEHCWSDEGIFGIEGGCYARCLDLIPEEHPEIKEAMRFGAIFENVVLDPQTREVDFFDSSLSENTRVCYPIDNIPNIKIPCVGAHPKNIIFLSCDAYGVLPPISRLSTAQAVYYFVTGYSGEVARGTDDSAEPQSLFSPCFGSPFLVYSPSRYGQMLYEKLSKHQPAVWLVNTGWCGGAYGVGSRISLQTVRGIIDAIHSGMLNAGDFVVDPVFGFQIPRSVPNVPSDILFPREHWSDPANYDQSAAKLARLIVENFERHNADFSNEILAAGPKLP